MHENMQICVRICKYGLKYAKYALVYANYAVEYSNMDQNMRNMHSFMQNRRHEVKGPERASEPTWNRFLVSA